jgi:hypothetical protein
MLTGRRGDLTLPTASTSNVSLVGSATVIATSYVRD